MPSREQVSFKQSDKILLHLIFNKSQILRLDQREQSREIKE